MIIDAHSFPHAPLPTETNPSDQRPHVCIGTDPFHTPKSLRECTVSAFEELGLSVAVNSPFEGVLIPSKHFKSDPRVHGVMIELNRNLYLEEDNRKRADFDAVRMNIRRAIEEMASVLEL